MLVFLFCIRVEKGHTDHMECESLTRGLLETDKCYILDSGLEVYVWIGKDTSLDDRKSASKAAEVIFFVMKQLHTYGEL